MHIVSYRGPSQPGGVAALIKQSIKDDTESTWWHLYDDYLRTVSHGMLKRKATIAKNIVEGHYRYCNQFLWPIMHERPELASCTDSDRSAYRALNMLVAVHLNRYAGAGTFIHDYQFALLQDYFPQWKASEVIFFWHIPWPKSCPCSSESHLAEIAKGLLKCATLGFHTQDYVRNFCTFIRKYLPQFKVSSDDSFVIDSSGRVTQLLARPAGIDSTYWHTAAQAATIPRSLSCPYILSVDRADYTKGIAERIRAVENIFRVQPSLKGKIQFVFICQPTRQGIAAFDEYWSICRSSYQQAIAHLQSDAWSPIVWHSQSMTQEAIAGWYAQAAALLVNPSIDGLNLTAKEFVASAVNPEALLMLSRGAGAWHELSENVVTINSCSSDDIADAILIGLSESSARRRANLRTLKKTVRSNSLEKWWHGLINQKPSHRAFSIKDPAGEYNRIGLNYNTQA